MFGGDHWAGRLREFAGDGEPHSGDTLYAHLLGTYQLLRAWNAPEYVCVAGLFHSIYGTATYTRPVYPSRGCVIDTIGQRAEYLVYLFCFRSTDSFSSLLESLRYNSNQESVGLIHRVTGETLACTREEIRDLAVIIAANAVEQARRLPDITFLDTVRPLLMLLPPAAVAHITEMTTNASRQDWISRLPFYFTWNFYWDLLLDIRGAFLANSENRLRAWLMSSTDLERTFNSLSEASQIRLFTAPAVIAAVRQKTPRNVARIRQMLRAELYRESNGQIRPKRCWTALGDALFPAGLVSPRICGKIVLDSRSPYSQMPFPGCRGLAARHSEPEIEIIIARLERAISIIGRISEIACESLVTFVRVIAIRRENLDSPGFASSSWPQEAGKLGLTNAHLPDVSMYQIVNALVHESVHNLLYAIESVDPFYHDSDVATAYRLVSPWSGRSLFLHSFIHACFVWFALWSFWGLPAADKILGEAVATRRRSDAMKGFLGNKLTETVAAAQHALSPAVIHTIDRMQSFVRDSQLTEA